MVQTRKRAGAAAESAAASTPVRAKSTTDKTLEAVVVRLLEQEGTKTTTTRDGWCLREGMIHVISADDNGRLLPLMEERGSPRGMFPSLQSPSETSKTTTPPKDNNCFQALCRIIAGQQLAGAAARTLWNRLLETTENNLTPDVILKLAAKGEEVHLQKPAGLSRAKARSIVALSQTYVDKQLSEKFLSAPSSTEEELREALLQVKGIGPWSCDMFLLFHLEKSNVLPMGDLGVRKGIAKYFGLRGQGVKGSLDQKKDKDLMEKTLAPFQPYQSLVTYYMWKVADTKDYRDEAGKGKASPKAKKAKKASKGS